MLSPGAKVFRGTVINADRLTGNVVVQLGGFGVADNYITISNIGRSPVNGRWKVPEVDDQVFITADDDSLSNPTLLEIWTSDPKLMTGDPIGHENRLSSRVSFSNSTRTFSIAPVAGEHIVWCRGQRFRKKLTESVQLPNTTNIYFIYYDLNANLSFKTGVQVDWGTDTPVAYVYWNSSTGEAEFIADERHGITLDWQTHEYLHRTRGSAYASGFGAYGFTTTTNGTAATNSDAYLGLYPGTFFDEDLQVDITHAAAFDLSNPLSWEQYLETPAQIPALYRLSTGWQADPGNDYPLKRGATLPVYNNPTTWTNVEIGNNKFGITWVIATNGLNPPILGIIGQAEYNTIGEAESVNWSSLDLTGLPIVELRPLYKVVYQVGTNYTNTPKAVLRGVYDLRISYSSFGTVPAVQTVDHGALTGLGDDDHVQYLNSARGDARYLQLTGGSVSGVVTAGGLVSPTLSNSSSLGLTSTSGSIISKIGSTDRFSVTSTGASVNGTITSNIFSGSFSGSGASVTGIPNSATTATSANTINAIVARDSLGNFSAQTITAASFSGSGASLTNIPNSATTATSSNTANAIVSRGSSGDFSAGSINATGYKVANKSGYLITQTGEVRCNSQTTPNTTASAGADISGTSTTLTLVSTDIVMVFGTLDIEATGTGMNTTMVGELWVNSTPQLPQILFRAESSGTGVTAAQFRSTVAQSWVLTGYSGSVTLKMTGRLATIATSSIKIQADHSGYTYMVLSSA